MGDLSFRNLFLCGPEDDPQVKLGSLDHAMFLGPDQTPPEDCGCIRSAAFEGCEHIQYGKAVDVRNLGVIFYFLLSHERLAEAPAEQAACPLMV